MQMSDGQKHVDFSHIVTLQRLIYMLHYIYNVVSKTELS